MTKLHTKLSQIIRLVLFQPELKQMSPPFFRISWSKKRHFMCVWLTSERKRGGGRRRSIQMNFMDNNKS